MHTPEHERWYEPIALGDAARVPSDVASEIQGCAECTRRIEEWRSARAAVDAAAREQRDVFARAREGGDAPGTERVERTLAELALANRTRASQRKLWLAAAATIVIGVGAWIAFAPRRDEAVDDTLAGQSHFSAMSPHDAQGSIERFEWSYPPLPGGHFIVSVRPWRSPAAAPILESYKLSEAHWEPSSEQRASLPQRFEWQVTAFDAGDKRQEASPLVSVSRP